MVVVRPRLARLGWLAALLLEGIAGDARAQDCGPGAILAAYRQAEAAYARKDVAAAAAQFRPLAEQGFGPAQLRLGQILAAGTGRAELAEAYRWTALAADIGAPGAKPALTALTARIGPAQVAQIDVLPAAWQPAQLWPCLAVDPHVARPDGTPGYDFDRLVNHLLKAPSATGPAERRRDWLMRALESVRTKSPRYLIYFKALYGIGFVGGPGPLVTAGQQDGQPTLAVNESYMDKLTPEQLSQMVTAAVYTVHATLVPQVAAAPATETYKGYTIHTTTAPDGRRFVEFVKYAIDMSEQLPPDLLKLARAVTDLRYEPHKPFDQRGGAIFLGTYKRDAKTGQGYVGYGENFSMRGPSRVVVTLVGAGLYQRRERATGKPAPPPDPAHGDCELEDLELKTMEALKLDAIEINRAYRGRSARGCSGG